MKKLILLLLLALTLMPNLAQAQVSSPSGGGSVTIDQSNPGVTNGVSLSTLISGEDQTNNLLRTSGGAVRQTIIATNVSTNTTSATSIIPVSNKSVQGILVCNAGGSTNCGITFELRGNGTNSTTGGTSLCTTVIPIGAATTAGACPPITANFSFYYIVTTGVAGTSPVLNVYAMY